MIYYGRHFIDNDDIREVVKSLKNDQLSQGNYLEKFEKKLSNYYNKNALLTSSATAALHIVITSLVEKSKNKKNDNYIITSPLTFVATTNACVYNNVKIQLCDIENESYNFDLDKLEKIIKKNKIKPLAIIAVHFGGLANFERLNHISKKYSIPIIDDGSQAMGAKYKNIELGISNHSVATIFSLHPVKTITS